VKWARRVVDVALATMGALAVSKQNLILRLRRYLSNTPSAACPVGLVLVGFSQSDTRESLVHLLEWSASYPGHIRGCLVMNREFDIDLPAGWVKISGSNAAHEFSGFDEGIARLAGFPAQAWLLCNDRLLAYEKHYLRLLGPSVLRVVAHHPVLVGHANQLSLPVTRGGESLGCYVRTNLVCVGEHLRSQLGSLTSYLNNQVDDLFEPEWPFQDGPIADSALSPEWLAFVAEWLTGVDNPPPIRWYRATRDRSQAPVLRRKAVAIANEHLLADRIKPFGGRVLSIERAALLAPFVHSPRRLQAEIARTNLTAVDTRAEQRRLAAGGLLQRWLFIAYRPG
jgi:hypothetical protein